MLTSSYDCFGQPGFPVPLLQPLVYQSGGLGHSHGHASANFSRAAWDRAAGHVSSCPEYQSGAATSQHQEWAVGDAGSGEAQLQICYSTVHIKLPNRQQLMLWSHTQRPTYVHLQTDSCQASTVA